MQSQKEARSVFFKTKELIKAPQFKHLALGLDKTQVQIAEYKRLRGELDRRLRNGERNLKIKVFKEIPKIINIPGSSKN
nr:unnamed protein product [Callosobruchus analis]